jgi:ATP-binding cassette subfamily C protein/ATP-binding cassette subfamily C protein EexD
LADADAMDRARRALRPSLAAVGVFSLVINLLMLTSSLYMMQLFDRVLASRNLDTLAYLSLAAGIAVATLAVLDGVRAMVLLRAGIFLDHALGAPAFLRAIDARARLAPYQSEALRDLAHLRGFVTSPTAASLFDAPWTPVYLAAVFLLHPVMGLVTLAAALVLGGLAWAGDRATRSAVERGGRHGAASMRWAEASLRNAEIVDALGMGRGMTRRWARDADIGREWQERAGTRIAWISATSRLVRIGVQIGIMGVGAWLVLNQQLTGGAMMAGAIIMGRALAPIESLISGWKHVAAARAANGRLARFFAEPPRRTAGTPLPPPTGRVTVERLVYAAPGGETPILKGIGLSLQPGQALAVIGPTAAGKTTFARCLVGVLRPTSGAVRLDGADVFDWPRDAFGRHVGYVPQDVELFPGTVAENITRLGLFPEDAAVEAAQRAGCHEMILRLPRGYETEVGDAGQRLSGGQRQRVALARAMAGRPRLLVLDEPNANLDGEGEAALVRCVQAARADGATVLVISHRPSVIQACDHVMVLRDGAVEMLGPSAEVMQALMRRNAAGAPRIAEARP